MALSRQRRFVAPEPGDDWEAIARQNMRADVQSLQCDLSRAVLAGADGSNAAGRRQGLAVCIRCLCGFGPAVAQNPRRARW